MTERRSVLQDWVMDLSLMQQSVLLTAVRGPDGLPKYHPTKWVLRWYRRCILLGSFERAALVTPFEPGGGSFTGPSIDPPTEADPRQGWLYWHDRMGERIDDYLQSLDEVPHHFQLHLMHAAEILGYKHPDDTIRAFWLVVYRRLAHDMHLWPETEEQLDQRLGDTRDGWLQRADPATLR